MYHSLPAESRVAVKRVDYEDFCLYYVGDSTVATASLDPDSGDWEIVLIDEADQDSVKSFTSQRLPSERDVTLLHNAHFNPKDKNV